MTKPSRVKKGEAPRLVTGLTYATVGARASGRASTPTLPELAADVTGTKVATGTFVELSTSGGALLASMLLDWVVSFIRREKAVARLACRYARAFLPY